ncbi:tetratricopeptide repeat protein [Cyanobium sp. Copco_Reservoir_LC18]|uniref:tetratricopeptide repeat protein n=1 Tax=Cyanobium sp. Copco_Reservoir_LC18 TaxID=1328305 RepID=UPI0027150292|nr:tetratricopeptide repeat protein [Cyanobium sp. Copco_Reservoir_LC18]
MLDSKWESSNNSCNPQTNSQYIQVSVFTQQVVELLPRPLAGHQTMPILNLTSICNYCYILVTSLKEIEESQQEDGDEDEIEYDEEFPVLMPAFSDRNWERVLQENISPNLYPIKVQIRQWHEVFLELEGSSYRFYSDGHEELFDPCEGFDESWDYVFQPIPDQSDKYLGGIQPITLTNRYLIMKKVTVYGINCDDYSDCGIVTIANQRPWEEEEPYFFANDDGDYCLTFLKSCFNGSFVMEVHSITDFAVTLDPHSSEFTYTIDSKEDAMDFDCYLFDKDGDQIIADEIRNHPKYSTVVFSNSKPVATQINAPKVDGDPSHADVTDVRLGRSLPEGWQAAVKEDSALLQAGGSYLDVNRLGGDAVGQVPHRILSRKACDAICARIRADRVIPLWIPPEVLEHFEPYHKWNHVYWYVPWVVLANGMNGPMCVELEGLSIADADSCFQLGVSADNLASVPHTVARGWSPDPVKSPGPMNPRWREWTLLNVDGSAASIFEHQPDHDCGFYLDIAATILEVQWPVIERSRNSGLVEYLADDPNSLRFERLEDVVTWGFESGSSISKDSNAEKVKRYRNAAEKGDAIAQFNLGVMYANGRGLEQDYAEAVKWYRKAADQGDPDAQFNLGLMYANGQGVAQDDAESAKWLRKAAQQGYARAQFNLGVIYANGKGVDQDNAEAVLWYRKAAELGHAMAQINLAGMYLEGRGLAQDAAEAVTWYRKAAEQGDADAQYNLGMINASGQGVAQDNAEAVKWYRKAAEQGHVRAQFKIGVMYNNGEGVDEDAAEAVKWYRKAAEQGHAAAQFYLGVMYDNGEGVDEDDAEAVKWYRKAAEQGHAAAQFYLGLMYGNGEGVEQDDAEAVLWYRKAAEQGNAAAQFNLGVMYDNGQGVGQNDAEALKWYSKAAGQGIAEAQSNLGLMYEMGRGVDQDEAEAVRWYRKAAEQDDAQAITKLALMHKLGKA